MNVNKVTLGGRLSADPEVRYTQGEQSKAVVNFTVVVNRMGKDAPADFINCVAFGNTGEIVSKYFKKGSNILLFGTLNIDSYTDKDGNKRYATKVIASEIQFVDAKQSSSDTPKNAVPSAKQAPAKSKAKAKPVEPEYEEDYESEDELPF